jgi:hypothetical protein
MYFFVYIINIGLSYDYVNWSDSYLAQRRSRVVSTSASCSEGPGFKSRLV